MKTKNKKPASRANILIVDDELGPRESLRMVLKDHYSLCFAENGLEATRYIHANHIDLVIMDLKMPVMDGMDALKIIKRHNPSLPVLVVTGYGTVDTAVEAMKSGAYDYIRKPFDCKELLKLVKKGLDKKKNALNMEGMIANLQKKSDWLRKQQQSLQKELTELSKLSSVGLMAQGIAHNISSPLLIILGRVELMKEKLINPKQKFADQAKWARDKRNQNTLNDYDHTIKDAELIVENVSKLSEIIGNMLRKAHQDQTKDSQLLNLSDILKSELEFLEANMFFKHHVQKRYELCETLPLIKGVYSDFSQSFTNLINNAIDAMRDTEKKVLTVKTYYDERNIYVEIRDTGCGIQEENRERIFKPYFSTKKPGGNGHASPGLGLGLNMVSLLLRPYSSVLDFKSEHGATTFILKIPYNDNR